MTTLELIQNAANQSNIKNRVAFSRLMLSSEMLESAINEINSMLKDKTPALVRIAKDDTHAHVYNVNGVCLILNQKVAAEYRHLPIATNVEISNKASLCSAKKFLLKQYALLNRLPIFKNGNFYVETKKALLKFI
jgi:hypothetical protein